MFRPVVFNRFRTGRSDSASFVQMIESVFTVFGGAANGDPISTSDKLDQRLANDAAQR